MYRETRTKEKKGWALLNFSWELREKVSEFGLRIKTQSIAFFFHLFKSRCCKRKRKNFELNDSLRLYLNQNSKKSIFQTFFFIELGRWKCEEREEKKDVFYYYFPSFPFFLFSIDLSDTYPLPLLFLMTWPLSLSIFPCWPSQNLCFSKCEKKLMYFFLSIYFLLIGG